jgi:hypothetical protein
MGAALHMTFGGTSLVNLSVDHWADRPPAWLGIRWPPGGPQGKLIKIE